MSGSMQGVTRTPSSILRKRPNKENEHATGRIIKRAATRRVSFAPDEELETKHIFEDSDRNSTGGLSPLRASGTVQSTVEVAPPGEQINKQLIGESPGVIPSPENLSPLSMDLTNNSDQPCAATTTVPGSVSVNGSTLAVAGSSLQPQMHHQAHQLHRQHGPYPRLEITKNVPNLSTLIEEDVEEYGAGDVSSRLGKDADTTVSLHTAVLGAVGSGYLPAESPMSPSSVREMQMCCDSEHPAGEDEASLRALWGFAPGKDDTLEVNCCREVMGERTFNHVYGTGTIGDLTRGTMGGRTAGHTSTNLGGLTKLLSGGLKAAIDTMRSPPRAGPEAGTATALETAAAGAIPAGTTGAGAAAPVKVPPADFDRQGAGAPGGGVMSMGQQPLRQEAQQPQCTEVSTIQAPQPLQPFHVPPGLAPQPLQTRIQVHSTPFIDNTTRLLEDDQTEAWRLSGQPGAYDRGRLSVASNRVLVPGYRRGAGGAGGGETTMLLGPTMTLASTVHGGNPNTVQLLAETRNQRSAYDRLVQHMPIAPNSVVITPITRHGAGAETRPEEGSASILDAAADERSASYNTRNTSLDLKLAACRDLLEDSALSIDNFQVPPEPTAVVSQLAQGDAQVQQRPTQARLGELALSVGSGQPLGHGGNAQAQTVLGTARDQPPKLSCQEFLSLIDISFINKICRVTFQPGLDMPPTTVLEVYEAATCAIAYVEAYHAKSVDFSARLVNIGTRVSQLEAALTVNKQDLFAGVKMLPGAELEIVKEKFASLKELCRLRTVKQIKQSQLGAMEDHLAQLSARKLQLQDDLAAVAAEVERLQICAQDASAIPALLARMRQEDEERAQEALQRKKTLESHMQRLEALRAQNAERQRRMDTAQAEHQTKMQGRPPLSSLMDKRRELDEQVAELRARLNAHAMTPGREGELIHQATRKFATIEAILGLHGLRLDVTNLEHTGTFTFLFRRAYKIVCIASDDYMDVRVSCEDATAAGFDGMASSIQDRIRTSSSELSCTIPRAQLPLRLEFILEQLQRLCRIAHQLERCWMRFDCMQQPYAEMSAPQPGVGSELALVLRFSNADTITGVTIRMPWSEALHSDYLKPHLSVQLTNLDTPETQKQYCDALLETVLSKLTPSTGYITAVCYAMSETLHVADDAV